MDLDSTLCLCPTAILQHFAELPNAVKAKIESSRSGPRGNSGISPSLPTSNLTVDARVPRMPRTG